MNLTANPIVITGSLATSYKTQTAASLGTLTTLIVERLIWVNPGASKSLSIGDPTSGEVLWTRRSNSAGDDVETDWTANPRIWQDFELNSFPGGTLYIFTR